MKPSNTTIIFGPPGTGKTTTLLQRVEGFMECGILPQDICFLAFTRKAANEARDRAVLKFNKNYSEFPLFRTIHSLVFKQLNLNRTEVMAIGDYINLAKATGLYVTFKGMNEDGTFSGLTKGDRLFFMESMARARMMTLQEYWEKFPDEDVNFLELERLANTIKEYKAAKLKFDFIDMLYEFLAEGEVPPHRHLIIDEAQDLSPLQWAVVEKISENSETVAVAGDDDQAIFSWAGADVNKFMNLEGQRVVLAHSYRVPAEIQQVAACVTARMSARVPKAWEPRSAFGVVDYVTSLMQVDLSKGTWLLLARNMFLLEQLNNYCLASGVVFTSSLGSPISDGVLDVIVTWENLRKGLAQPVGKVIQVYEFMTSKVGVAYGKKIELERQADHNLVTIEHLKENFGLLTDKIWHEALDRIPPVTREYFISALRRGEKLLKEPRIRISTIHSVKGGEAENVLLLTDMAPRTFSEYHRDPDSEHRVWYVAVTRAKERLIIMSPMTNMHYEL